jgi:uncharacterized protein with HEPN domain
MPWRIHDILIFRLADMKKSIVEIRSLLRQKSSEDLSREPATRAAFERFLEILSAASQHVPEHWQSEFGPEVPWRRLADLEKHIRRSYHRLDPAALWSVYVDELDRIERAVDAMLAPYASDRPPSLPHA